MSSCKGVRCVQGCAGGIMITASHNPKQYNGYKVYWGNGCQVYIVTDVLCDLTVLDEHLRHEQSSASSVSHPTIHLQALHAHCSNFV